MRKEGLWALYSIDRDGMKEYYPSLVEAVRKSLDDDEVAALDRKRLRTAERLGPGCVKACAR
jgi:DnaJ-domain-containing protein 1